MMTHFFRHTFSTSRALGSGIINVDRLQIFLRFYRTNVDLPGREPHHRLRPLCAKVGGASYFNGVQFVPRTSLQSASHTHRMFVLRVAAVLLLVCGVNGWTSLYNIFNNCHPPETLVGKFCAAMLDNDVNGDGFVDNDDINYDLVLYDRDGDVCTQKRHEVVRHWTCRYGWSSQYGHFMFERFDNVKDGVITNADFAAPFKIPNADFLNLQYTRFKDQYCSVPENRANRQDAELCRKVNELKPEDIKCRFV